MFQLAIIHHTSISRKQHIGHILSAKNVFSNTEFVTALCLEMDGAVVGYNYASDSVLLSVGQG